MRERPSLEFCCTWDSPAKSRGTSKQQDLVTNLVTLGELVRATEWVGKCEVVRRGLDI